MISVTGSDVAPAAMPAAAAAGVVRGVVLGPWLTVRVAAADGADDDDTDD